MHTVQLVKSARDRSPSKKLKKLIWEPRYVYIYTQSSTPPLHPSLLLHSSDRPNLPP